MKKNKFNPKLLNEELKRFRMISEYSFYHEDSDSDDNLILGTELEEVDEEPNPTDDSKTAANNQQQPTQPQQTQQPADMGAEQGSGDMEDDNLFGTEEPVDDMNGEMGDDMGGEMETLDVEEPAEDEVEVDVTQLVSASDEAKQSAQDASQKTDELLAKFTELEQRISAMSKIADKIEALEKEVIKRNPTPVEKLQMRAMDSFPYNIKLSDYFKDEKPEETKPKEYVLTKDDIDSYTDASIKDTFNVPDYEEEDI